MASLPSSFAFGSVSSSGSSVIDAIESYRRSQYLAAGNPVVSGVQNTIYDEESGLLTDEGDDPLNGGDLTPRQGISANDVESPASCADLLGPLTRQTSPIRTITASTFNNFDKPCEGTPLLHRAVSFSSAPHPRRISTTQEFPIPRGSATSAEPASYQSTVQAQPTQCQSYSGSVKSTGHEHGGKSTFGQSLFNSIAVLLGIGMLSEPLAFAYAGWIGGTFLIISIGYISCYTAKILANIMLADPRLRSYADIGRKAFGPRPNVLISLLFCFEMFSVSVVLVTLYADSLHSIMPTYSPDTYKVWGLIILIPTVFLPLSLLSYASFMGILAMLLVVAVIFIDGLFKKDTPGSLWTPAPTSYGVDDLTHLGLSFGLFMAGFAGHGVIPVLSANMIEPQRFDQMINWAFIVATSIYALVGAAGYVMFGNSVSDEISVDLVGTPGYNHSLNQVVLVMLVLSPLSKFALSFRPVNIMLEAMLNLEIDATRVDLSKSSHLMREPSSRYYILRCVLTAVERVGLTLLSVGVSILVPGFSSIMALLGSLSAFMLCIIGPILARVVLTGRCGTFDSVVLGIASIMAVWGTITAFWAMGM